MSESDNPRKAPGPSTQNPSITESDATPTESDGKRSRSQSRRARRRRQNERRRNNMPSIGEDGERADAGRGGKSDHRIATAGESAKAKEVGKPVGDEEDGDEDDEGEDIMKKEGLKLRLELDLDIELELKARIKGAVTLALL